MIFDALFSMLPLHYQAEYKKTYQDHRWHPEGSVYNHSKLVSSCLPETNEFQLCALLHDIGKLFTSEAKEIETGIKITTFNHEDFFKKEDFAKIQKYFVSVEVDWNFVNQICFYHMRMHLYNDKKIKKDSKRKFMEELTYFNQLQQFSLADKNGIGNINDALPYVIINCGISGSGKSTWTKKFISSATEYYCYICPDEIRKELTGNISDQSQNEKVWKTAYERLDCNISKNFNVVFDSTMCNVKSINEMMKHCSNKAIPIFNIFECDVDVAASRVKSDIVNNIDRSAVPRDVIERQKENFAKAKEYITLNRFLRLQRLQ